MAFLMVQQLLMVLLEELLVLNGDVPLLRAATIDALVEGHRNSGADVTLLTARLADPTGYGRVFADTHVIVLKLILKCLY